MLLQREDIISPVKVLKKNKVNSNCNKWLGKNNVSDLLFVLLAAGRPAVGHFALLSRILSYFFLLVFMTLSTIGIENLYSNIPHATQVSGTCGLLQDSSVKQCFLMKYDGILMAFK